MMIHNETFLRWRDEIIAELPAAEAELAARKAELVESKLAWESEDARIADLHNTVAGALLRHDDVIPPWVATKVRLDHQKPNCLPPAGVEIQVETARRRLESLRDSLAHLDRLMSTPADPELSPTEAAPEKPVEEYSIVATRPAVGV